jgi:hypothetical protein
VFPTELPGASEPPPRTFVTPRTANELLARAPPAWRRTLEAVASLVEVEEGGGGLGALACF